MQTETASTWNYSAGMMEPVSPPSYDEATSRNTNGELTFVDFIPVCLERAGFLSKPVFESFGILVGRANTWLQMNPSWQVKTCESVEFKCRGVDVVQYESMTYLEYGDSTTCYIRGFRMWIIPRPETELSMGPQQIGYLNLIPEQIEARGFFSMPVFEALQSLLDKFNSMIRTNPLPGRIITVETQEMKIPNYSDLNPDNSFWWERGQVTTCFVFVLRVFYENKNNIPEEIGIYDFIPQMITPGGILSLPEYERFPTLVDKAAIWCKQQNGLRFCNAQSITMKTSTGKSLDSQKMNYHEYGGRATHYIRIFRLVCVKNFPGSYSTDIQSPTYFHLSCKMFVPVQLTHSIFVPKYESLAETRQRVQAWVRATGAQVISAETLALRLFTGGEARDGLETCYTYNPSKRSEYWIFVIRLYLNGVYQEPPPERLPPVPQIQDQGCCTIL